MKNKKEKLVVILLVVGLIVMTVAISYAAFRFTQTGTVLNQITTGSITMSYTESSNVISMTGALPTTDATGKVRLNEGEYFDFTVGSSITGTANINYEIAAQELDGNTIDGKYIKYYLTKVNEDNSEEEVMAPTTYTEETTSNEYTGRPSNMMSLYEGSMNASTTTKYRLRLYVDESYNPQGDGGNLVYKVRVNVYGLTGDNGSGDLDMSTVSSTLGENDWETIQKVVSAGKVAEAGWSVGDTKTLTINGAEQTATIIGLDHDGENTATFMIISNIGTHAMNSTDTNVGGWEASEMRTWLNGDIYNSMSNKNYIKEVTKMTDNVGGSGQEISVSATSDKVFLLSVIEVGLQDQVERDYEYSYMDAINGEGTTYEWFANGGFVDDWFLLRSPNSDLGNSFFAYNYSGISSGSPYSEYSVFAAFVIGE